MKFALPLVALGMILVAGDYSRNALILAIIAVAIALGMLLIIMVRRFKHSRNGHPLLIERSDGR